MRDTQSSRKSPAHMPHSKRQSAGRFLTTVKSARVEKRTEKVTARTPKELTPEQLERAQSLANIYPGQRAHTALMEKMRSKYGPSISNATTTSSSSPLPDTIVHNALVPISTARPSAPAVPQQPATADWEVKALKAIEKRGLTLDKVWTMRTWNMKSSILQRLKLLKDDGYDITALQGKGITSDQVTEAVLDHIEARKQRTPVAPVADAPQLLQLGASHSVADQNDVEMEDRDTANSAARGDAQGDTQQAGQDAGLLANQEDKLLQRSQDDLYEQPADDLLMGHRSLPEPLTPQKRKHNHEDDEKSHDYQEDISAGEISTSCGPARKRLRTLTQEEMEKNAETEAFDLFKKNIVSDIFRLAREARAESTPRVIPAQDPLSAPQVVFTPKPPEPGSRIVFAPPDPSPRPRPKADVWIGSKGFAYLFDEIKYLAHAQDSEGTWELLDPEAMGDHSLVYQKHQHRIGVSEDSQGQVVMEGDADALRGLMKRLRENDLIHTAKWRFDGMEVVRDEGSWSWSLSDKTEEALAKIEKMLEAAQDGSGVVVRVEQLYNGKKFRHD